MDIVTDMLVWVVLWVIMFGLVALIPKRGITYTKRYGWLILFFLFFTFLAGWYFKETLAKVDGRLSLVPIAVLILVYLTTIMVYYLSRQHLVRPTQLIDQHSHQYFIKMDYRYLISKSFDILFQQVMIMIMVTLLSQQNYSLLQIMLYFVLLFGIVHVFALFSAGKIFGTYYLVASIIGAVVFPILILKVSYGFVYSYIIHFFFYSISSLFFWLFARKIFRKRSPS